MQKKSSRPCFEKYFITHTIFKGLNDEDNEFCSENNEDDGDYQISQCLQSINVTHGDTRDQVSNLSKQQQIQ